MIFIVFIFSQSNQTQSCLCRYQNDCADQLCVYVPRNTVQGEKEEYILLGPHTLLIYTMDGVDDFFFFFKSGNLSFSETLDLRDSKLQSSIVSA